MADALTWKLNADTSQVRSEMQRSVTSVKDAGKQMIGALLGVESANGRLLNSHNKVGNQVKNVAQDLLAGADATQTLARALEGLEKAFRIPLGSTLVLTGLAVLVAQMKRQMMPRWSLTKVAVISLRWGWKPLIKRRKKYRTCKSRGLESSFGC